tara:strand:- start:7430 stop:8341 length:912 start_codon:yes stop_codon:yes gene_type:complete
MTNSTTNSTTSTTVPSISSAAMLVELSIGTWTGRKLDKRASQAVTTDNHADKGVANVHKKLLGDCAELDAVQKFTANARNTHYACTMPWSDTGLRLLPTTQYFKYHQEMTTLQNEYKRLVDTFLDAYSWEIQNSQLKLGDLFNADEYPTADSLTSKFRFKMNYMPLPDVGDWRVSISNETEDALRSQYEGYYATQLQAAMSDVWKRAHDALTKMSERLDYADDMNKKVFRDSLVTNVQDMIELLDVCNVTNDPVMAQAQCDLDDAMRGITPDALREDLYLRAETRRKVNEVRKTIDNLPSLGF